VIGLSVVILAMDRATAAHLNHDQRIVQLMSAGDPTHVVVIVGLTCVAAPLVEETLFRGLLLEALRPRGVWLAIWTSAFAFAIWHFLPSSLIYYTAMGIGLGRLYIRKGMASSMAAHACFNGVLTVAAVIVVLGPAHTYDVGGLAVTAPSGWTEQKQQSAFASDLLHLNGPGGSEVILESISTGGVFDPASTAARITASADSLIPGGTIDPNSVREEQLPAVGTAVEADFTAGGDRGEMALFALDGRPYGMLFVNGGSARAASDFTKMLDSLAAG
jgi:hypothetical protein